MPPNPCCFQGGGRKSPQSEGCSLCESTGNERRRWNGKQSEQGRVSPLACLIQQQRLNHNKPGLSVTLFQHVSGDRRFLSRLQVPKSQCDSNLLRSSAQRAPASSWLVINHPEVKATNDWLFFLVIITLNKFKAASRPCHSQHLIWQRAATPGSFLLLLSATSAHTTAVTRLCNTLKEKLNHNSLLAKDEIIELTSLWLMAQGAEHMRGSIWCCYSTVGCTMTVMCNWSGSDVSPQARRQTSPLRFAATDFLKY